MRAEVRAFRSSSRPMFSPAAPPKIKQRPDLRRGALSSTAAGVSTTRPRAPQARTYDRSMYRAVGLLIIALSVCASASPQDFWEHWGDGRAELNGYALKQPRYGALRSGSAVLIFVTEDFSDALRVKAEPSRHRAADVFPVLKLNAVRDFATGIYDYNVMTSAFVRIAAGWPLAKLSFSSQDWCGQVWHQLVPRAGRLAGVFHSYFDGEADGTEDLELPQGGVVEDALPVLLRGWNGAYLEPGERRSVPFLPSLLWARLNHRKLADRKSTRLNSS